MKLATLKDETRDGCLALVSRDLKLCVKADDIAPTLQAALDDWDYLGALLAERCEQINTRSSTRAFEFDPAQCMAPLPRAFQWLDGSSYLSHAERARRARGAELPKELRDEPLMYQGASDVFIGARDEITVGSADWGVDLEAEIAVVLGDVPMGVKRERAAEHVRLLMVVNDVTLRGLVPGEIAKGLGLVQAKPWTAFAPCAVTPDELGDAWDGRRLRLPVTVHVNDTLLGRPDAGRDMSFDFPRLIAHAARTRPLRAGTVLGAGTVSNRDPVAGVACLAERRALEMIESGEARTPFLADGDRVRIEVSDAQGRPIFGAIDQRVRVLAPSAAQAPAAGDGGESPPAEVGAAG